MIAHEDVLSFGFGAEIAARIASELFASSTRRWAAWPRSTPGSATIRSLKTKFCHRWRISSRKPSVFWRSRVMELVINIHVEHLPEGVYLATSDELPGLVAQGRTVAEALEIARDVARRLIESRREREGTPKLPKAAENGEYQIVVAA